jgi:lipoyl synthase
VAKIASNNSGHKKPHQAPNFCRTAQHLPTREKTVHTSNKQRGAEKILRIPIHIENNSNPLKKPDWIRIRAHDNQVVEKLKTVLREKKLHTVCEEASCPNLPECFSKGTATFMIMGDKCTRRCTFCDVGHGRPDPLDPNEPLHVAQTIQAMGLQYVVITSVDRDDLRDGGANHFVQCLLETRAHAPNIRIEILVPDFRGRMEPALAAFDQAQPDVFNHNIETVPRLYKQARPGSDYAWSLQLLKEFKNKFPHIPTKSGLMLGLGETNEEVIEVLHDLRAHQVDRLTLGQYLAPSAHHIRLQRYVHPDEFKMLATIATELGFENVASGPLVRSSYHADLQAAGKLVT